MKTSFHLKSSPRRHPFARLPLIITGGAVIVAVVVHILAPRALPSVAHALARPFWNFGAAVAAWAPFSYFTSKSTLIEENTQLKATVDELNARLSLMQVIETENAELKRIGDRQATTSVVLASVLRTPPFSPYDTLIVDVGAVQGIEVGAKVFAHGSILVGEVSAVNDRTSQVVAYSSPNKKFEAFLTKQNIHATSTGQGGGTFEITLPRSVNVGLGDPVTLPSISPALFGTVEYVTEDPARTYIQVLFKSPVNISELAWVTVERR